MNTYKSEFCKTIKGMARECHTYEVFNDFCLMSSVALENAILKNQDLENTYLQTISKYKWEDQQKFPELLGLVVQGLESPHDLLGSIYMELELYNSANGQFFTPSHLSELCAKLTFDPSVLEKEEFITLSEPACGAGSMVIAYVTEILAAGYNPQKCLWVSAVDLDPLVARMCFIQLALLHIPAEVVIGDALRMKYSQVMRTPAHHLGLWDFKLTRKAAERGSAILISESSDKPTELKEIRFDNGKPIGAQIGFDF